MNLSGRRRTLLVLAVIAVVALGVAAVAFGLGNIGDDDDGGGAATTTTTTSALTTTTTIPPGDDTTTTTAAPTTTTTAAATTTTTRRATTTTSAATTTTTLSASPSACGTGQASVAFTAKDLVTTAIDSSFTPQATVNNGVSQPIEVEEIILDVTYPGNEVRTVRFDTTGTVIAPGNSASFTADKLTTARRYESARFTRFTYFTQGQQANCRVTTP
ncbi:MAG: hypothetical protein ACLGIO_01240 [Acidimicrobiia bacterium]